MIGLDLDEDDATLTRQLRECEFTRIPVYKQDINNIVGFLHLRSVVRLIDGQGQLNRRALLKEIDEPYFVPEGTPLHTLRLAGKLDAYEGATIGASYSRQTDGNVKFQDMVKTLRDS